MPRPPFRRIAALATAPLALLTLVACGDGARTPTQPTPAAAPSAVLLPGPACTSADEGYLFDNVAAIFAPSVQNDATAAMRAVRRACGRPGGAGPAAALDYVALILAWRGAQPASLVTGSPDAQWTYLTRLFRYVGYSLDNTAGALGDQGFIGLCTPTADCTLVSAKSTSGIRIYAGALDGRYLVTGAPTSCGRLDEATDLQVWGQCIEVSVGPYKDASYPFRRPTSPQVPAPALVRVCATEETYHAAPWLFENAGLPDAATGRARVGQRSGGANRVQVRPRVDGLAEGVDFTLTGCDRATVPPPETAGGFGAVGASWLHRAGETLATLFAPRVAWAGHGGLSGLPGFAEQTSVFGPVDPFVFQATFTGDAVGGPPTVPDLGRGSWTIDTTQSPGSVLVRSGIGDIAGNVAVIDQAGGAAGSKAGAALLANLAYFQESVGETGVRATTGRYRLRWTSLVATPRAFGAPFHAFGPDRAVLARVSFENGRGAGSGPIHFNGSPVAGSDGQPLRWTQNRKQRFELLVDLDAGRAELRAAPFVDESAALASGTFAPATPLVQAGWLLGGIDAQIIGTDDWEIVQLPARLTPR